MTVVARRVASTPARTASETWKRIVSIVSKAGSGAHGELEAVAGIAASIIADEIPKEIPIVLIGNGPRLRVYCVYGEDAVIGDDCDEATLAWTPSEGEWKLFLPCPEEDLGWVRNALQQQSSRIFAYEAEKGQIPESDSENDGVTHATFTINLKEFLKK